MKTITDGANKILTYIIYALAGVLALVSIAIIYENIYDLNDAFNNDLKQYKPVVIEDDETPLTSYNAPSKIGNDYRGWLTIDGTFIDYPIMQGKDDFYYATHDAFGASKLTGITYLASANSPDFSDNYNIIYGHHMDNSAMFGCLDKFQSSSFFQNHKTGRLIVDKTVYDLRIFAAAPANAYDTAVYAPGNRDLTSVYTYLGSNAVQYERGLADAASRLLALSTCADTETDGRTVVFATMTENPNAKVAEPVEIGENRNPLAGFSKHNPFKPRGNTFRDSWALINLISLILTIYLLIPLGHLKAKFKRRSYLKDVVDEKEGLRIKIPEGNEIVIREGLEARASRHLGEDAYKKAIGEVYGEDEKYTKRFWIGFIFEFIFTVIALILFILAEDMRLPMVLIDEWTIFMLLLLLIVWIFARIFVAKKSNLLEDTEDYS